MDNDRSFLILDPQEAPPSLERNLLKDRATKLLRDYIISGRIHPGARLVERVVARQLGISRAPVRDALIQLEQEGLVVSKSDGRYVVELSERDVRELYQVRRRLERLAVELATQNTSPENRAALLVKLQEMRDAVSHKDRYAYTTNDVETHCLIWRQADNRRLLEILNTMLGPIFMFVASNAFHYDWNETLELHEDLANSINSGDVDLAVASLDRHVDSALHRSLQIFRL
jgi:DNA-binding GntR family transcriptional regulator